MSDLKHILRLISDMESMKKDTIRHVCEKWLKGLPIELPIDNIEPIILMKNKIRSKLKQALRILDLENWDGFFAITGVAGSGKTQFTIWLLNKISKLNNFICLYFDASKQDVDDVDIELSKLPLKEMPRIGIFIDNVDIFVLKTGYLDELLHFFNNLLDLKKKYSKYSISIFFVITLNQSTWVRFSHYNFAGKKISSHFKSLSSINLSIHDLSALKRDLITKLLGAYYFCSESEESKNKISKHASLIIRFLRTVYDDILRVEENLKRIIMKMAECLKVFTENLDPSTLQLSRKNLLEKGTKMLREYIKRKFSFQYVKELNDYYNLQTNMNIKTTKDLDKNQIITFSIECICDSSSLEFDIPVLFFSDIKNLEKSSLNDHNQDSDHIFIVLCEKERVKHLTDAFMKKDGISVCIPLPRWFRYLYNLRLDGIDFFLNDLILINNSLNLALYSMILLLCSQIPFKERIGDALKMMILRKTAGALLLVKTFDYIDYKLFLALVEKAIISDLAIMGIRIPYEYKSDLINSIISILESEGFLRKIGDNYLFYRGKMSSESILKVAKKISYELAFRIKFIL